MKTIYYEPAGRIHSSQWELINNPPEGYKFVTKKPNSIVGNDFIFDKLRLQYLDRMMPLNYIKAKLDSKLGIPKADMTFAYNHLVFRDIPWVVLVEWANILVGRDLRFMPRYKKAVESALMSDNCRGILTWSLVARESMLVNYDIPTDKVTVVPHALRSRAFDRSYNHSDIRLLFVGSTNTPEDFDAKGAMDVVEAFKALRAKYKGLKLTVRARIPKRHKLDGIDGLDIIESVLTKGELDSLFMDADIFVLPSHFCQEMVLVEAMSFGLPIVTSWIGSTCGEYVKDGITGFVLQRRQNMPYFIENMLLTSETIYRQKYIQSAQGDSNTIDELVSTIGRLIEDSALRERVGRNAKEEVDSGRFSIEHRDKLLEGILNA